MKLMRNLILIKPEEVSDTFEESGIIVRTEQARIPPPYGEVLSTGPEVCEVSIGDRVLYAKFAVQEVDNNVLIKEDDVLAVYNKGEDNDKSQSSD